MVGPLGQAVLALAITQAPPIEPIAEPINLCDRLVYPNGETLLVDLFVVFFEWDSVAFDNGRRA